MSAEYGDTFNHIVRYLMFRFNKQVQKFHLYRKMPVAVRVTY